MKGGATDFLCKPVAHEELTRAVTRALNRTGGIYTPPPKSAPPTAATFVGNDLRMREIEVMVGQIGWS